jgi:hypothetical protein
MRFGVIVECAVCGLQKKPHGRSEPMYSHYCDDSCSGYAQEPRVGCLWPGETPDSFGYPCCDLGTVEVEGGESK